MAEEGEFSLLDKAREQLGFDMSDATILYTGVGAINVIHKLMDLDREAEIYNIGYAGSANFDLGTWVEVTEVRLNHPNVTYPEPELRPTPINVLRTATGSPIEQSSSPVKGGEKNWAKGGILDDLNCAKVYIGLYEGAKPGGKFENPGKAAFYM